MQSFESVRDKSDYFLAYPLSTCKKKWMNVEQNIKEIELRKRGLKNAVKYLVRMPTGGQECNMGKWFNYDEL